MEAEYKTTAASGLLCPEHKVTHHEFFISYRKDSDKDFAGLIAARLPNAFWDENCIGGGAPWQEVFERGLRNSRILVPLISAGALLRMKDSQISVDRLLLEWDAGLEVHSQGKMEILPILIRDMNAHGDILPFDVSLTQTKLFPAIRPNFLPQGTNTVQDIISKI